MPFAGYEDFDDCVRQNQDKSDPEAYCAAIQREAEGESMAAPTTEPKQRTPRVNEKNLVEKKTITLKDVKFDADQGTFKGYASVFGVKDLQNDIILPGAFRKTIKDNDGLFVLLDQHDIKQEIGLVRAREDEKGLLVEGEFYIDSQADPAKELRLARETYIKMKRRQEAGKPLQFSIGYRAISPRFEKGARLLGEVGLAEVSTVTFPAAPLAITTDVKGEEGVDLKEFGEAFREAVQRRSAAAMADTAMMFLWDTLDRAFYSETMDGALELVMEDLMSFNEAIVESVRMFHDATEEEMEVSREALHKRAEELRAILTPSTEVEEPQVHSSEAEAADDGKAEFLTHLAELKSALKPQASPARLLADDIRTKAQAFRARATKGH